MNRLQLLPMLIVVTQFACATRPIGKTPGEGQLIFDQERVQPYSEELEKTKPVSSPFVARYHYRNKELYYVAARHLSVRESPDLRKHPTFKSIQDVFSIYKPDCVVFGGLPSDEVSPPWYVDYAKRCEKKNFADCGESALAAFLADQNHIPFMNGDPSDAEVKKVLTAKGFSEKDVLGFFVARLVPQHFRNDAAFGASKAATQKVLSADLTRIRRELGSKIDFDYVDWEKWLKPHASVFHLREQDFAPLSTGTFLQKISAQVDWIRNRESLKRIESALHHYDRVMVVYGSGHYLSLNPAFEAAMGKAAIEKRY